MQLLLTKEESTKKGTEMKVETTQVQNSDSCNDTRKFRRSNQHRISGILTVN